MILYANFSAESASNPAVKSSVVQHSIALALSFLICQLSTLITNSLRIQGGILPCVTVVSVIFATLFPSKLSCLAPAGEVFAVIMMQVFSFGLIFVDCIY